MTAAIMQPYLFPYIGYFQLMAAVDEFVLYDNIKFTKKGWIHRNRILVNGKDAYISLPLKKDSDFLNVRERRLADTWASDKRTILNRITGSYKKARNFREVYPLIEASMTYDAVNLFEFIHHSILLVKHYLEIPCAVIRSSSVPIDHGLKSEQKVIAICKQRKASTYINPIGGMQLYSHDNFKEEGIDLQFIKMRPFEYRQFDNDFIPFLSIIDVMMFNAREEIKQFLSTGYTLV